MIKEIADFADIFGTLSIDDDNQYITFQFQGDQGWKNFAPAHVGALKQAVLEATAKPPEKSSSTPTTRTATPGGPATLRSKSTLWKRRRWERKAPEAFVLYGSRQYCKRDARGTRVPAASQYGVRRALAFGTLVHPRLAAMKRRRPARRRLAPARRRRAPARRRRKKRRRPSEVDSQPWARLGFS